MIKEKTINFKENLRITGGVEVERRAGKVR